VYRTLPVKRTNTIEITQDEIKEAIVVFVQNRYTTDTNFTYSDLEEVKPPDVDLIVHATVDGNDTSYACTAKIEIVTNF
jgi:hypothetical protein